MEFLHRQQAGWGFLPGLTAGLILAGLIFGGFFFTQIYLPAPLLLPKATVTIEPGESLEVIATKLWVRRLIKDPLLWIWYVGLTGRASHLQAGTYEFSAGSSPARIARLIAQGAVSEAVAKFTVIPGENLRQLDKKLAAEFQRIQPGELLELERSLQEGQVRSLAWMPDRVRDFIRAYQVKSLEGLIVPETYFLSKQANLQEFLLASLGQFEKRYLSLLHDQSFGSLRLDAYEVLTLASLLEKEVETVEDRRMVADILLKRLEAGMPLQVDATVNYATGKNLPAVTLEDTKTASPYNTYQLKGLPPGPIAAVSLSSIQAVLSPEPNPYWFYLSTPDRRIIYSKTFQEHKQAKSKYLTP